MIELWDKGPVATTLRYPYKIRDAKEYFDEIPDIEIEPDMLKLAEQIVRSKTTDFDPSQFVDRYEELSLQCSRRSKPACRYRVSMSRRGRRMLSTSWTRSAAVSRRNEWPLPQRRGIASA